MTAFFSRRGGGAGGRKPTVPVRVGQAYLDARQRMLYCLNETARQLLREGVPLSGDNIARAVFRTLEGKPVQASDLPVMRAWREGRPHESSFLFTGPDGVSRHLTWNASPLADRDGVCGILSSLVVAAFEPDWQHLAGLAHDLRTPLQALRLLMPLLESAALQPESRSLLERIRACADRTLAISLALLAWARSPTRGEQPKERRWFALEPFLHALADEHVVQAQNKEIGWRSDFTTSRGLEVYSDRVNLGRLMSNLMSNAIRYTPRGEVTIRAGWRAGTAGPHSLFVLSVEDTGTGISPEDQDSIFQPFERGRSGRESDSDGSGLGLSVVDRLVEELGLTLEVFSEYGRGSRFEVLLPADCVRKQ
ncbi:MAG TPA: HAMP domain-containing sensor histidine kinase [Gemmataceae bacterium]|nr:HAMP domain-containing sensor histidine kinase [Gemmataceae bacterium]